MPGPPGRKPAAAAALANRQAIQPQRKRARRSSATVRHTIAQTEHAVGPAAGPGDSRRMEANRAAVAANQAYRAGDLDQARQLIEQAAALDPSRAGLWQQHREQIAARRLILDARAAHAAGDQQRADKLLGDARQLDPRMPAIWDGDLPGTPPAQAMRHAREHDTASPGPNGTASTSQPAERTSPGQQHEPAATSQARGRVSQPAWPSAPVHREPDRSATATRQADGTVQGSAAAASREPSTSADAAPDATTDTPGDGPARWPAPNPRSEPKAVSTGKPGTRPARQQGPTPAATEAMLHRTPRDLRIGVTRFISSAREPWQPAPNWPHNPAVHRSPDPSSPDAGIEAGQ